MGQMTLDISSCRALTGKRLIDWHNLVAKIAHIHLSNEKYTFTWDYISMVNFQYASCINTC